VDTMAQQTHGIHGALPHQHDEIDAANRAAFEECFAIIKKAWTEPMLTYRGKYWRVPVEGTPWTLDTTLKWGAGVEDGILKSVGVVPKPLQKPHPPIFQPFASSERSIRWCAKEGVTAILPAMHARYEDNLYDVYADVSGRRRGGGMGILRHVIIADSDAEAIALWRLRDLCRARLVRAVRLPQGCYGSRNRSAAGQPGRVDRERVCAGGHGRHGHPQPGKAAPPAAGRMGVLLHLQQPRAARCADEDNRALLDRGFAPSHVKCFSADSPHPAKATRQVAALRQISKQHNVLPSFCYQLPVNQSPPG
ncbi:MAG: LLM class flavin-dependent oxidoreductase, partial [Alphaproteobacteria bacterium]|nr:LLM class flavin-dependent oxidoreductase [Alphaproteobacteria bacterium]MBV9152746.1 LLM class flavin-dependent oxidoreductase [Alphaproteobacteria bacterium]